jgi:hypothetical protein
VSLEVRGFYGDEHVEPQLALREEAAVALSVRTYF